MGQSDSKADVETYRNGYPGLEERENPADMDNLLFYRNQLPASPSLELLDDLVANLRGNFARLERDHAYVQWLFPIREHGMNPDVTPLTMHEARVFQEDKELQDRVVRSYEVMLDFYGMRLVSRESGEVERVPETFKDRYYNMCSNSHNFLRVTRILKSLGEVGLEPLKAPWVEFLARETFEHRELWGCEEAVQQFWIPVLRVDSERQRLEDMVRKLRQKYQ